MPDIPENLTVKPSDGAVLSQWSAVKGADGYILRFFRAENAKKPFKSRYSQGTSKTILGFKNGETYYVGVCAFRYINGKESVGEISALVPFVPICDKLKAQSVICLEAGESAVIKHEYKNTVPAVTYTVSDPDTAVVDADGTVRALKRGKTAVTLKMQTGEQCTVTIEVGRSLSRAKHECEILLAGDLMCAVKTQRQSRGVSYDISDAFEGVSDILRRADFSAGVLETTCCDSAPFEHEKLRLDNGAPNCNSPSVFVTALKNAGFKGLITANNHNCDTGKAGLDATVREITENGLYNIGTASDNPVIVTLKGINVAFIACNTVSNGSEGLIGDKEYIAAYSADYFSALVAKAKRKKADFIIAYQHFGMMNSHEVRNIQREIAREMADMGADMIIGSHPHVLQKAEYITAADGRRVFCAYSLGNFFTSMREMTANSESALIRLLLTKRDGGISAEISYIPTLCKPDGQSAKVYDISKPVTAAEKTAYDSIAAVLGDKIAPSGTHKILLQGSVVLKKIFERQSSYTPDSAALIISQLSLLCGEGEKCGEKSDRVRLDIEKSFPDYIKRCGCDCIAVDFYTAASMSCYQKGDTLYTASAAFEKSDFYKQSKSSFKKLSPPFPDNIWKPAVKRYAELLRQHFPKEKIILIRLKFSEKCAKGNELRNGPDRTALNKRISEMERYFIDCADPCVIDIAQHYFASGSDSSPSAYEEYFYVHAAKAVDRILSGERFCIADRDNDIWVRRTAKYFDNMTARAYTSWLLDGKSAADILMQNTSAAFIRENADRFALLKAYTDAALSDVPLIFANTGADDFISAANAVNDVLNGDISKPFKHYAPIFDGKFVIQKKLAKLLCEKTGAKVCEQNVKTVFMLKNDPAALNTYFSEHPVIHVDIWGSCVSRESVKCREDALYVGRYLFKQPLPLAFEPDISYILPDDPEKYCGGKWRMRTIKEAFYHEGFSLLEKSSSRFIVVDLYDVICRMAAFKNGLFEVDDFVLRTAFYREIAAQCRDTYLYNEKPQELIDNAVVKAAQRLKTIYNDRIILVRLDLKDRYMTLDNRLEALSENEDELLRKKEFLNRCELLFAKQTGCYIIDIAKSYHADDRFPLGGAHIVHYESEFYRECGDIITRIVHGTDKRYFTSENDEHFRKRDLLLNTDN